uniref:Uncharacterized protein n=1 Tax=Pelusios castaneus TaxID=367368 RepID=A0A8C8SRK8_9SAUR
MCPASTQYRTCCALVISSERADFLRSLYPSLYLTPVQPDARVSSPPRPDTRVSSPPRPDARVSSPPRPDARVSSPPRPDARVSSPPRPDARVSSPPRPDARVSSPPRPDARVSSPPRPDARVSSPPRPGWVWWIHTTPLCHQLEHSLQPCPQKSEGLNMQWYICGISVITIVHRHSSPGQGPSVLA